MRRAFTAIGAAVLAAVVVIGLISAGSNGSDEAAPGGPDLARQKAVLADAPPPLDALYAQGGELLDGETAAFKERIEELRGHPVVVNKWASWCGPCRIEFPHFRDQALKRGKEIAFIGVNSADVEADARRFLAEEPVPFPSYRDPDSKIAEHIRAAGPFPQTAFYNSRGERVYTKPGPYRTEADLAEAIERYAK